MGRKSKIQSLIALLGVRKIFMMDSGGSWMVHGGWMESGFHCRIKIELFLYDLMKFTFIFWGIEKGEKQNKMKRKAKRIKMKTYQKIYTLKFI